jgi:hypothetical protein
VTEELGPDHRGIDRKMQKGVMQRVLLAFYESNVVSQAFAVVLLAGLLRKVIFKHKKYNLFPVWATIEIALTCYILSGDGLSRRI